MKRSRAKSGAFSKVLTVFCFVMLALYTYLNVIHPATEEESVSSPSQVAFEIGFSPKGKSLDIILDGIDKAKKSIIVAAYTFTSKPISEALLKAHKRGVDVKVVADAKSNSGQYSAVTFLANQGVPVRVNSRYTIFHHKFMVFDGLHVETGSFNYSAAAAEKNAENVLLLLNVPEIAERYSREWQRLWNESKEVPPKY